MKTRKREAPAQVIIGMLTILPAIYVVIFIVGFFLAFLSFWHPSDDLMAGVFAVHFAVFILMIALLIYYLRHAYQNDRLMGERKTIWIILLLFAGAISMPIYWYYYIHSSS